MDRREPRPGEEIIETTENTKLSPHTMILRSFEAVDAAMRDPDPDAPLRAWKAFTSTFHGVVADEVGFWIEWYKIGLVVRAKLARGSMNALTYVGYYKPLYSRWMIQKGIMPLPEQGKHSKKNSWAPSAPAPATRQGAGP
ncbi:MAG: hypothetical protein QOE90_1523 [Thermoplasmata archaeon]|jgi:hypothetical protein|nr:hypothetical protein [Thermoplasmata archaeon]